jgi:hypothetical protein
MISVTWMNSDDVFRCPDECMSDIRLVIPERDERRDQLLCGFSVVKMAVTSVWQVHLAAHFYCFFSALCHDPSC